MKILSLALTLITYCFLCCTSPKTDSRSVGNKSADTIPERLSSQFGRFFIPLDRKLPDENELLFFYSKIFDTSYLIHFRKERNEIKGVFYEVLPSYHSSISNFADENDKLLFFEGYSFRIDSVRWAKLAKNAERLLRENKDTGQKYYQCNDCPSYYLLHNSRIIANFGKNSEDFADFVKYLSDSLLSGYVSKWKPVLHKKGE